METILSLFTVFDFNALEVLGTAIIFMGIGYYRGRKKFVWLQEQIYGLENEILELNAELLYPENATKVINLENMPHQIERNAK
jgi:hypothetical protein